LGVTIEIFWPRRWFINVDFPAFGGPTIATMPDLTGFSKRSIAFRKIIIISEGQ
jgi:hypothetical protein